MSKDTDFLDAEAKEAYSDERLLELRDHLHHEIMDGGDTSGRIRDWVSAIDELVELTQACCGGDGCGTDESKACLRCCRIMLKNYAANHGTYCDNEQTRLLELATEQNETAKKLLGFVIELAEKLDSLTCNGGEVKLLTKIKKELPKIHAIVGTPTQVKPS